MILTPSLIWFLIGVAFLVAEMMLPGFILVFFTAGSWIAALAVWLTDIDLTGQILLFAASSLILLFTLRKYGLRTFKGNTRDELDDDYDKAKIGKTAVVTKAITPNSAGEIKVMGSFWMAIADTEIKEGESVLVEKKVTEDGLTYKVRSIEK